MTKRTCEYCDHWKAGTEDDSMGECRKEPPSMLSFNGHALSEWPRTLKDEWCGSFAMRIVEAAYDYESRE